MELSDCPHAVGTPEHLKWINGVYIPAVSYEKTKEDRAKYGAESIGGRYIDGMTHKPDGTPRDDVEDWVMGHVGTWSMNYKVELEPFTQILMPRQQARTVISGTMRIFHEDLWKALTESPAGAAGSIGFTDDEIDGSGYSVGRSRAERRAKVKKPTRPRRGPVKPNSQRQCPRHGGPAESCKFCRR